MPTADSRNKVKGMTAVGIKQDDICLDMGISPHTLRKHYATEIKTGMIAANAAVGGALFKLATTPGPGQVSAAIFWSKVRMGWTEIQKHELSGPDGTPITEVRRIERVIIRPGAAGAADVKAKGKRAKDD
jgi:hypothetical protein